MIRLLGRIARIFIWLLFAVVILQISTITSVNYNTNRIIAWCNGTMDPPPKCLLMHMETTFFLTEYGVFDGKGMRCYYARATGIPFIDYGKIRGPESCGNIWHNVPYKKDDS